LAAFFLSFFCSGVSSSGLASPRFVFALKQKKKLNEKS